MQDPGVELRLACPQSLVQQGFAGQQLLLGGLRLFPLTPQIQGRGQSAVRISRQISNATEPHLRLPVSAASRVTHRFRSLVQCVSRRVTCSRRARLSSLEASKSFSSRVTLQVMQEYISRQRIACTR